MATTPSGMVQLAMDGVGPNDPLWVDAEECMCRNWGGWNFTNAGNMYASYALAKAMRSAIGGTDDMIGENTPAACPGGVAIDWYDELANYLVGAQNADGSWRGFSWTGTGPLASAWAIIILKPTLFCPAPVAMCDADPDSTTNLCPVDFDGTQSFHPGFDNPVPGCGTQIVTYEWDFDDGNTAMGDTATHTYGAAGVYDAELTVTDDVGITGFAICQVTVSDGFVPPDSNPDGPYELCLNIPDTLILDGSGSLDPDNFPCQPGNGITAWDWELDFVGGNLFDDASGETTDQTAFFTAMGVGVYNVGLRVTDDEGLTNDDFTTVVVRDDCPPPPCPPEPDPRSQGYWHRQCLGLPEPVGIDPGREGRGPQAPNDPDFEPTYRECADQALEDAGFFGMTTCEGMDADLANDQCEKAKKQYTAMLLNICSGRIADGCEVDPMATGCDATSIGALKTEIAGLIMSGDCNKAKSCAASVNEGYALTGGAMDLPAPVAGPETAASTDGARALALAGRTSDRVEPIKSERADLKPGEILYYLAPPDYFPDDPRIQILSRGEVDEKTCDAKKKAEK
jgi:PKD repeat protein